MKTIKAPAFINSRTKYSMASSEVTAIENEVWNATHEACVIIHTLQCDAIQRECYTPAARVEMVLQLARLSTVIGRAGFNQCRQISGT